ncbi:MAG: response regulator [Thalassobaculum sp.]|uniref:response regulator n=1 Tax=Thalassobaculum sp. TaxID=2022740 RepID=UPI0032F00B92
MAASIRQAPGRALLVEDELLVAVHVEELLEQVGYVRVAIAARVEEALVALAAGPDPTVAVLDVNLAGEQSWPVARECRRRGIPWVFVTGYLESHAAVPADLAGAVLLAKPLGREELAAGLARAAAASEPGGR